MSLLPDPWTAGPRRAIIENVTPALEVGAYPFKVLEGDPVRIEARVFADGHEQLQARIQVRGPSSADWEEHPLKPLGNDHWAGEIWPRTVGIHHYRIVAWVDPFFSWRHGFEIKLADSQNVETDAIIGLGLVQSLAERRPGDGALQDWLLRMESPETSLRARVDLLLSQELEAAYLRSPDRRHQSFSPVEIPFWVERKRAGCSAWYEFFPRSFGRPGKHGTFKEAKSYLDEIATLGFNVVYLPPIHPIGRTFRKGRNNTLNAEEGDVGSPWAIGSAEGGHKSIHPDLGNEADFREFIKHAEALEMEVALDIAFQCSPDHPYVREHPQWFRWRPDGTVQYAENPPKKYQDILPFDFETDDWQNLWKELKAVFLHWIGFGIKIFRVDNPHTKPLEFWRWLIGEIKLAHPEVIFLSEAFTRPSLKYRLGKSGFTQGYTYFTWRNTKEELTSYLEELCSSPTPLAFWPNFWPNTPDILPELLQYGGAPAFAQRVILAATLSSNYGLYGPAYERCVNEPFPGKEEYLYSEKYELKQWSQGRGEDLSGLLKRLNQLRRDNPALRRTFNLTFVEVDNPQIIAYLKRDPNDLNILLVVVNLDPHHRQSGWLTLPLENLRIDPAKNFLVQDLLPEQTGPVPQENYLWHGPTNYVELDPASTPAHIFRIFRRQRREQDFDYWM